MHTKHIEYAISMVAHPKALTIRAKATSQLNDLLVRVSDLENKLALSELACEEQIRINSNLLQGVKSAEHSVQADKCLQCGATENLNHHVVCDEHDPFS